MNNNYYIIRRKCDGYYFCGQYHFKPHLNGVTIYIDRKQAEKTAARFTGVEVEIVDIYIYELTPKRDDIKFDNEDFFTPNDVRQMTHEQVRKNYTKIMESMKFWH